MHFSHSLSRSSIDLAFESNAEESLNCLNDFLNTEVMETDEQDHTSLDFCEWYFSFKNAYSNFHLVYYQPNMFTNFRLAFLN